MNEYFVVYNSDGDTYVKHVTEEQLTKQLNENYYGREVINRIDNDDTNYWDGMLIIKGEICVPKKVEVVTKYEV